MAAICSTRNAWLAGVFALAAGCVDNVNVSKLEIFLRSGVHIAGADDPAAPPSDTHYEIYVVKGDVTYPVAQIDILPVIRRADPCFIEMDEDRFPGLHSTKVVDKTIEDAMRGDPEVTPVEAGDIANAKVRVGNMQLLEESLKVMAVHEPGLTNQAIAALLAGVPGPDDIGDAANAQRLAACKEIFRQHPNYYVGTDKITTIPINGTYIGMVEAMDPRNGGFLGGGQISVDASFPDLDAVRVNWNFNDPNDPRRAGYPLSSIGWHYLSGRAVQRVRGVYNVSLVNQDFGRRISGEISVYTDLSRDDVNF